MSAPLADAPRVDIPCAAEEGVQGRREWAIFPRDVADAIANADAVLVAYEAPHFNESAP